VAQGAGVVLFLVFIAAFYGFLFYAVGVSLKEMALRSYAWLSELRGPVPWSRASTTALVTMILLATAGVLGFGAGLFWFRLKWRALYDLIEVMVGVLIAVVNIVDSPPEVPPDDPSFVLVLLTASVYLVVRGLDNVHQGSEQPSMNPVAFLVRKLFYAKSDSTMPYVDTASDENSG
jgi:hypothetical protein